MNSARSLDHAIDLWFKEDIREGDHTTLSTIPEDARGTALLMAKQKGVLAGAEIAALIFSRFDGSLVLEKLIKDGESIHPGDRVFRVRGPVRSILQCERIVLNVMQRMSGIATATREYVRKVEGTGARILDTRKNTPGFRMLEKEAVRLGGGVNHRFGLYDMILIKDNHIDFAGGIEKAIERVTAYIHDKGLDLGVVIETRSLEDVEKVHSAGAGKISRIMFDNFTLENTRRAVDMIDGDFETESSGGITLDTIRSFAECGVDFISVGAITHQVRSLDLSLIAEF